MTLGAQNDQQVTFNYLLAQGEYRISTLLAVLFAVGFAIGWLICGLFWAAGPRFPARAERKIKRLENKYSNRRCGPRRFVGCSARIIIYVGVVISAVAQPLPMGGIRGRSSAQQTVRMKLTACRAIMSQVNFPLSKLTR